MSIDYLFELTKKISENGVGKKELIALLDNERIREINLRFSQTTNKRLKSAYYGFLYALQKKYADYLGNDKEFFYAVSKLLDQYSFVDLFVDCFYSDAAKVAAQMKTKKDVKNLAFITEKLRGGGVERVVSLQVPIFMSLGKRVIVINETKGDNEYKLPDGARRYVVGLGSERYNKIRKILSDNQVDTVMFTDYWRDICFKTIVWAKLHGYNVIAEEHNFFFCPTYENAIWRYSTRLLAYRCVNVLTCLNQMDERLWWASGIGQAKYVPNPATFETLANTPQWEERQNKVLLIARLCRDKGIHFIPQIISDVAKKDPDVRFVLCGWYMCDDDRREFEEAIAKLGVKDKIEKVGYSSTEEIKEYLRTSKCLILPSTHEGSPMVLLEARAYGLPSVIYDMSYLDNAQQGVKHIKFGDIRAMADSILHLIRDRDYWQEMSSKAKTGLNLWERNNLIREWNSLFLSVSSGNDSVEDALPAFAEDALQEFHNAMSFSLSIPSISESDRVKIHRYDELNRVITKFAPTNSLRRSFIIKTIKFISRISRKVL